MSGALPRLIPALSQRYESTTRFSFDLYLRNREYQALLGYLALLGLLALKLGLGHG